VSRSPRSLRPGKSLCILGYLPLGMLLQNQADSSLLRHVWEKCEKHVARSPATLSGSATLSTAGLAREDTGLRCHAFRWSAPSTVMSTVSMGQALGTATEPEMLVVGQAG
jgi:hypothetical protein